MTVGSSKLMAVFRSFFLNYIILNRGKKFHNSEKLSKIMTILGVIVRYNYVILFEEVIANFER